MRQKLQSGALSRSPVKTRNHKHFQETHLSQKKCQTIRPAQIKIQPSLSPQMLHLAALEHRLTTTETQCKDIYAVVHKFIKAYSGDFNKVKAKVDEHSDLHMQASSHLMKL